MDSKKKKWAWIGSVVITLLLFWLLYALVASRNLGSMVVAAVILLAISASVVSLIEKAGIRWFLAHLGEQDVWWSPVRMKPGPGHIMIMTKGLEPGPFDKILAGHIPYWRYHEGDRRFYKESDSPIKSDPPFTTKFPPPRTQKQKGDEGGILDRAGVAHVGFVRRFYRRKRRWDVWDLPAGKTEYSVTRKETKKEEEHIFYFATTMAVNLETVPTKDVFPAQMKIVFNVLLIHPEKAEFTAGKWEVQAVAAVRARALQYIQSKSLAELRKERDTDKTEDFVDAILKANEKQAGETGTVGLFPEYGIVIQGPYYEDFDLESGDKEMVDALKRQQIAKEDLVTEKTLAEKAKVRGQGKAQERQAEAEGIRTTVEAWGSDPAGITVVMAEAIKEAQPSVIGGNVMAGISTEPKPRPKKK